MTATPIPTLTPNSSPDLTSAAVPAARRFGLRAFLRLLATELKLVLREPVVLTFVFAFPVITVLVLGGVFDPDDPAFEGIDPAHWFAAAYVGVVIAAIGLIMLPVHTAGYRERGVLRRFQVSDFPRWHLPLVHLLVGVLMTVVGSVTLLIVAGLTYGVPPVDDVGRTMAGAMLGAVAFSAVGVAIGSIVSTARSAQGIGMMLFFPSFLLGGGGPPPDAMGGTMKTVADVVPLTHVVRSIQEPWLGLGSPTDHNVVVAAVLVVAAAVALIAARTR